MNTETLMQKFKSDLKRDIGIALDFRTHQYLPNTLGLAPTFEYKRGVTIITYLYEWANKYVEDNEASFPHFSGFEYNIKMACDELTHTTLKSFCDDKIHTLYVNHIEEFRVESGATYRYAPNRRQYVYYSSN